ncbi:unnamed protein product [Aureobasidium uvarum]|uniref:Cryptic loci regulator 2 N-terminal domain-containing protein n=1 Tax=Aureobasidium uvarum TaxID=2773716 RepID=A0A9N8KA98_9PEZI|nr:unnamed protein product [Aureobasidium uvarum]
MSSSHPNPIENQSTFCLWFHPLLHDLYADTTHINDKDVKIWRLDLLSNSDGDETKRSNNDEDTAATEDRMDGFLNAIEKECEKLFGHTTTRIFYTNPNDAANDTTTPPAAGTHILSNPTDKMKSLPFGYALMHRSRGNDTNRKGDLYLWGHPSGLGFNSAAKFVKHLKWLIEGQVGEVEGERENFA